MFALHVIKLSRLCSTWQLRFESRASPAGQCAFAQQTPCICSHCRTLQGGKSSFWHSRRWASSMATSVSVTAAAVVLHELRTALSTDGHLSDTCCRDLTLVRVCWWVALTMPGVELCLSVFAPHCEIALLSQRDTVTTGVFNGDVPVTTDNILGAASLIIWTITAIPVLKYLRPLSVVPALPPSTLRHAQWCSQPV